MQRRRSLKASSLKAFSVKALRNLPVEWRIYLIVAVNAAVLMVLAALAASGAKDIVAQWRGVGAAHAEYRVFAGVKNEVSQLQGLAHRYLSAPGSDLLAELDSRRYRLLKELESFKSEDPDVAADFARLSGASRRFIISFDAVRETAADLRRVRDAAVLRRGPEMTGLLGGLEGESRAADAPPPPGLNRTRDSLFEALAGFNAFYLSGDAAAAERTEAHVENLRRDLAAMRDAVDDPRRAAVIDALTLRADELAQALAQARRDMDRRSQLVVEEIDGRQRAMAEVADRLIAATEKRRAAAERAFLDAVGRLGWQLGAGGLALLSLGAAVSWAIGRSIVGPLRGLRRAMDAAAAGNFDRADAAVDASPDEIGAMAQALEIFKDNAQAKRRMERERDAQERRWRLMLESSPFGVSIIRARDFARVYTNPKYEELFGLRQDDSAAEWPLADSFADSIDLQRLVGWFNEGGPINGWEVRRRRRDGGEWWCQLDVRPVDYRGERSFMVWHYDVTERLAAADDLRVAKEKAEAALEHLHEAQESLVQAEKMAALGSLVAGVAHEINTPVGIAVTAASHLVDESENLNRKMRDGAMKRSDLERFLALCQEASGRILSNAQRAAGLIQSFKQVAVDQTYDDRRSFDLGHYLQEVAVSLGPKLKPGGHSLTIDCPPAVAVDGMPGALAQVVTNLVVNSVTHGFSGAHGPGRIALTVTVKEGGERRGEEREREIVITYADDGAGIAPDVLPRIFDPFFTTNRAGGGSGLGLNIVYNIVQQKLHGRIFVESAPGEGARFTIAFPAGDNFVGRVPTERS